MGSHLYWKKVIPVLAEEFRVVAIDLPGHCDSANITEEPTIESFSDLIKDLLDSLNIKQSTMFGHSLGGYITLAFAEKYSHYLNAFALIHSTALPDTEEAKNGRLATIEKVKKDGVQGVVDGLVPKLFSPLHLQKNSQDIELAKEIGYKTSVDGTINALLSMRNRPDRNHVLESTTLPVLLLAGKEDQIIPSEKTFSVKKENIKQSIIVDSGHMSMLESPKRLIKEMKDFLASI